MVVWGYKTVALFDVWSIEHLVSGANLYFISRFFYRRYATPSHPDSIPYASILGWVMALCFAWEALEHYLEIGWAGAGVAHWLQGVEYPLNRLVTDPLMIAFGALAARRWTTLYAPAKAFSCLWLFLHIVIFPDSMYLQRVVD